MAHHVQHSRAPLVDVIQVGGASEASGKGGLRAAVAPDEAAHVIAEAAVPLAPDVPVGEAAHLVQPAAVPGLRQQPHLRARAASLTVNASSAWSAPPSLTYPKGGIA